VLAKMTCLIWSDSCGLPGRTPASRSPEVLESGVCGQGRQQSVHSLHHIKRHGGLVPAIHVVPTRGSGGGGTVDRPHPSLARRDGRTRPAMSSLGWSTGLRKDLAPAGRCGWRQRVDVADMETRNAIEWPKRTAASLVDRDRIKRARSRLDPLFIGGRAARRLIGGHLWLHPNR